MARSLSSLKHHGMILPTPFISNKEKTFQHDEERPSLPVPPLQRTLHKYLESAKLHLTNEEYEHTRQIVEKFANGEGKDLQYKLLEKAKFSKNWVAEWWDDYAYLANREPHCPFVNFAGPSPYIFTCWPPAEGVQIQRAALALWTAIMFWQLLYKEMLVIDRGGLKEKNIWSMSQFRRMFNSCKIPGEYMDSFSFNFKTESEGGKPLTHIMVQCRGRIFTFDGVDENLDPFTSLEYEVQLKRIKDRCSRLPEGPGLGALTGHKRAEWYRAREHLKSLHPDNVRNLDIIETAVFAYVLEDEEPATITDICRKGLSGNSKNRWFDKSMCHISFKNGVFSCNCDHAPHDAMVMVSATLWSHMIISLNGGEWQGTTEVRELPEPQELVFHLDDVMYKHIDNALKVFKAADESLELLSVVYSGYGRSLLRQYKVHPDTHCQIAGQLAYYRLYGKLVPTYETASTRKYYNARTETIRSCTEEALDFSKSMMNENTTKLERLEKMQAAYKKHIDNIAECQNGMGIDRHMFGLYMMAVQEGKEIPEIFNDVAFTKSGGGGNYIMSTSFVGYSDCYGGVAPMCKDGYGYFYAIQDDRMTFWVTSWTADTSTNAKMFYDTLVKSLEDMKDLLQYGAELQAKDSNKSDSLSKL